VNRQASLALFERDIRSLPSKLLEARGWSMVASEFPRLDVAFRRDGRIPMLLRLNCEDWNSRPPSMAVLAESGGPLTRFPTGGGGQFHSSAHPVTRVPFICMPGSLEYHIHPSHTVDSWDNYRDRPGYDLGGLVTQVWRAWLKVAP